MHFLAFSVLKNLRSGQKRESSYLSALNFWVPGFSKKEAGRQDFCPQTLNFLLKVGGTAKSQPGCSSRFDGYQFPT
jgi:hypothetical protein